MSNEKNDLLRDKDGAPLSIVEFADLKKAPEYSRVAHDVVGDYRVSTMWSGIRMPDSDGGMDAIFETMVFPEGSLQEVYLDRYKTLEEAEEGHQSVVQMVRGGGLDDRPLPMEDINAMILSEVRKLFAGDDEERAHAEEALPVLYLYVRYLEGCMDTEVTLMERTRLRELLVRRCWGDIPRAEAIIDGFESPTGLELICAVLDVNDAADDEEIVRRVQERVCSASRRGIMATIHHLRKIGELK